MLSLAAGCDWFRVFGDLDCMNLMLDHSPEVVGRLGRTCRVVRDSMRPMYAECLRRAAATLPRHFVVPEHMSLDLVAFVRQELSSGQGLDNSILVLEQPGFYPGLYEQMFEQEISAAEMPSDETLEDLCFKQLFPPGAAANLLSHRPTPAMLQLHHHYGEHLSLAKSSNKLTPSIKNTELYKNLVKNLA